MTPRNLAAQINNDKIRTLVEVESELPRFVDAFGAPVYDWVSAIRTTSSLRRDVAPDLILEDVHFEDDSSTPLGEVLRPAGAYRRPLPTGLTYLRQYATLAVGLGRPLGIAIHSFHTNADIWRQTWKDRHPAGALAVSEIGLLAAVLGQGDRILGDESDHNSVDELAERCLEWLVEHTATANNVHSAFPVALRNYRKMLLQLADGGRSGTPSAMLAPSEWARIWKWLEAMRADPRTLNEDDAVTITYADGTTDCIRLLSLFSDCDMLATRTLPSSAFDYGDDVESDIPVWSLDSGGKPQLGQFLFALSETPNAYLEAVSVVQAFPTVLTPTTTVLVEIGEESKRASYPNLTAALGVLMQAIRREHAKYTMWQDGLRQSGWNPKEQKVETSPDAEFPSLTLDGVLNDLFGYCKQRWRNRDESTEDALFANDILEDAPWPTSGMASAQLGDVSWAKWHFDRLVDAGFLEAVHEPLAVQYRVREQAFLVERVPSPSKLPSGFGVQDSLADSPYGYLTKTLGYSAQYSDRNVNDDRMIPRIIARYFLDFPTGTSQPEKDKAGRQYLEQLLSGNMPPWLRILLQDYAEYELVWRETSTWPGWMDT